jgi:hypothetical protein
LQVYTPAKDQTLLKQRGFPMARLVFVLLIVALFSQSDVLIPITMGCESSDCKPCFRAGSEPGKEIHNKPPDVTDIALEKTELHIPPRKDNEQKPVHTDELIVGVTVTAQDPEGDTLTYNYTISGGRIVGTGAKVSWNLNGVLPGTYTITSGVDDGCGICGKTMTRSITVVRD